MADTADISLRLKLNSLRKSLKEIPGLTKKEVRRAVRAAQKEWSKMPGDVRKVNKKTAKSFKDVNDQVKKLGEVMQGSLGSSLGRLGGAVELIGGLGAVGGPLTVAAAGAVALGAAFGGVQLAMIGAVFAADDLLEGQKKLAQAGIFSPIDPAAEQSIRNVNDAAGALGEVFNRLVVDIALNVAPSIEDLAIGLVQLALMAEDTFQEFTKGQSLLRAFSVYVVDSFIQGLFGPIRTVLDALGLLGDAFVALGAPEIGAALKFLDDGFDGLTNSAAEFVVDGIGSGMQSALASSAEGTKDYRAEAQALVSTIAEARIETDKDTEAKVKNAAASKALSKVLEDEGKNRSDQEDSLISIGSTIAGLRDGFTPDLSPLDAVILQWGEYDDQLDAASVSLRAFARSGHDVAGEQQDLAAAGVELEAWKFREIETLRDESLERERQRMHEITELGKAKAAAQRDFAIELVGSGLSAAAELFEILGERSKGAAIAAVVAQKAGALLEIGISTAVGVAKAIALFGPPPSPLGIAGIAAAVGIGGAQAAVVAATPTSFHGGGIAPDEGVRKFQKGEGTVSTRGVEALAALNRGDMGGGGGDLFIQGADHRVFDGNARRSLTRRGAPLRAAVARAGRSGRGTRRYGRVRVR